MNNQEDSSVVADESAEGSPEIGLSLDQLKVEVEDSMPSPQLRNMEETPPPTRRSTSKMDDLIGDVKPPGRIRATSYSCDIKRSGLISAHFASNDTVCVWNDQTGQSIVVASNQSTRDALASLCQRDSKVERMETAARISWKKLEDRTVEEKTTLRLYHEEYANARIQQNRNRTQSLCSQPKRSSRRVQGFIDPTNLTAEEAQAMFYTYLNYTQQDFGKIGNLLHSEHKQLQPFLNKLHTSSVPLHRLPRQTIFVQNSTVRLEYSSSESPSNNNNCCDAQNDRGHFGMSRFLENNTNEHNATGISSFFLEKDSAPNPEDSTPSVLNREDASCTTQKTRNSFEECVVNPALVLAAVNRVSTPATPVHNDVGPPVVFSETANKAVVSIEGSMKIEQCHGPSNPQQLNNPETTRKSVPSPLQRSMSTPASEATDEDLIAFLREPLALARAAEQEALRKKAMEPKLKRKSRAKNSAKRPVQTDAVETVKLEKKPAQSKSKKNSRSKSTPSSFANDSSSLEPLEPMRQHFVEGSELQKPSPELHPGTGQSSLRNFIRLDMPLGQALQEVPLGAVAGQLRVQKALYEKMDGMNGIAPESASTSGQTFMQDPAPPLPPKKAAPKRKKPTKAEIEAAGGNVSSVEKPKKPRAPSKKKAQGTVQQEHQMISMTSAHQGQTEFHQPSHQSTHQPLPSVANLLPPLTGYQQQQQQQQRPPSQQHHNGVVNNNTTTNGYGYSDVSGNGGSSSSSSSVYSSYSYSMQPTSDPPKKHQSLASMLTPITFGSSQPEATNTGSSQIYTDKNQYHLYNDNNTYPHQPAMYSNQTSSNGYYGGYEDVSNNQFQQPDYPPLSVESQVSCHSQESNITYHSSMPVTPISQQANNGSLYNPMPVTKDNRFSNSSSHIQQDHEDLSVEQFAQKYAFPSDNFFEMQNSRDSQETNSAPLSMARASNASPFDELGIYLDSGPSTSHTQDDPFADIELSDPPLSITPQVAQEPVQTTIMSNRVIKTPSSETHPQSYANVQYVPMNPSLPVSSHSESQVRSTKKLPSNFKEDDIRHSTCPDNCNKCVSEKSNADISMQPSPASTIVTVPQSQRMDQHLEQQRGVEQLAATDDEQICYVKYLPHEISHTNLGRPRQQSKPSGVGVNGTSHGLTNQGPPPLPPPKRSRAKPKKKNAFEQDMNASSSGHAYQMQNSPEVSIGKLLKQQHLNRPNQFNNISGQSQIDLATLQQSVMLSPKLQRYSEPQTMQKFSHHQKEAQVHEKKNHMQQGSAKQEPIQHRQVNLQQVPTQQSSGPAHQSTIHYAPMKQQIKLTSLQSNKTSQEHQSTTLQAPVEEAPSDQFPENFLEQPDSPDKVTEVINNVVASVLSSPDEFRGQKQFTKTEKHLLDGTSKPTPKKQSHVDRRSRGSFVHYVQGKQQMISQQQNRNAYQVQQQQQPNASSLSTMNEQYEVVLDNTNLQNPMSEQQVQMNYQTSIVQQTSVEQQGPLQLQNQIQVTNQQTHRVQYQHHPVQHNQRNGPTKAAPRKRTPKPAPVQSRSVALHERAQMIVDFAKTQPADQEDQTVQLQDHEHQYNSQQQPEYQHQPLVQMQEQSNEQQSQVFQHQHQHQAQQELAENQGSMGMATQQQQCRQSQLQQQLQQPPQQQMQIQQQYQNVGPSHIQRQNVAPQRVQQQPMQYAQQQQQPMMQMAQQRSMQEQYVQQGQVQRTGATHTVLMTSPPMNHHESQANVLRVAPKQTIVKSADPKPEDEAKILKILKDKLASDDGQNAPKMSPVLRVKHIRETINIIAALPSLTIEELFDKADTPPPDEYMEEYMDFYDKITHLMKDEPCVPEINVEDVLSTPLLEPALHGRFRKRLIAIREGRTTVTTFKKRKTASGPEGDAKKRKPTNNHTNGMHTPDASPAQGTSSGQSSSSGMQSQSLSITTGMSSSSSSPPASDFDISTHLITPPQEHSSPLTTPPIINHEYVQQVSSPVDIFSQPSTSEPGPSSRPIRTGVHHREEALNEDDNGSPILYDDPIMGYVGTNRFVSLDMDDMIDDVMKSDDTEEMLVHNLQRSIFDVGKSFEDDDEDDTNVIKLDTNTDNHRPATPSVGILDDLNSVLFDPIMM